MTPSSRSCGLGEGQTRMTSTIKTSAHSVHTDCGSTRNKKKKKLVFYIINYQKIYLFAKYSKRTYLTSQMVRFDEIFDVLRPHDNGVQI